MVFNIDSKLYCENSLCGYNIIDKERIINSVSVGCLQELAKLGTVNQIRFDTTNDKIVVNQPYYNNLGIVNIDKTTGYRDIEVIGSVYKEDLRLAYDKLEGLASSLNCKYALKMDNIIDDTSILKNDTAIKLIGIYTKYLAIVNDIKYKFKSYGIDSTYINCDCLSINSLVYKFKEDNFGVDIELFLSTKHADDGDHIYTNIRTNRCCKDTEKLVEKLKKIKIYLMKKYDTHTDYEVY